MMRRAWARAHEVRDLFGGHRGAQGDPVLRVALERAFVQVAEAPNRLARIESLLAGGHPYR